MNIHSISVTAVKFPRPIDNTRDMQVKTRGDPEKFKRERGPINKVVGGARKLLKKE